MNLTNKIADLAAAADAAAQRKLEEEAAEQAAIRAAEEKKRAELQSRLDRIGGNLHEQRTADAERAMQAEIDAAATKIREKYELQYPGIKAKSSRADSYRELLRAMKGES